MATARAVAALLTFALASQARAGDLGSFVGLDKLIARLGQGNQPTGAGIPVAQVEAPEAGSFYPDQTHPELAGRSFFQLSGPGGVSGHATLVAQNYYGDNSIAPGVNTIFLFEAGHWLGPGHLRNGSASSVFPFAPPGGARVFNLSWICCFPPNPGENDVLRRGDLVVDRDDILLVCGVNNGGTQVPLMTHMYNVISVGNWSGGHASGPTSNATDGPGRMKPEIVAPGGATSFAAPVISGAAALLLQTAHTWPGLSANLSARKSEVIKAAILAGANHRSGWSNNPATTGPNRGITSTPLDSVWGVDLLNIDRSHRILTGLEQNGAGSVPSSANATAAGWDFANIPVGGSRYYRFNVTSTIDQLSVLATWHRVIGSTGIDAGTVANFDLILWRATGSTLNTLVGSAGTPFFSAGNVVSQSSLDNLEHLFVNNLQPGQYVIELKRIDTISGGREVAIGWLMPATVTPGDITGDGVVGVADLLAVISAWGPCPTPPQPCPADIAPQPNGDGVVGVADLLFVISNWG